MKIVTLCILVLLLTKVSIAQTTVQSNKKIADSIRRERMTEASLRNPVLRQGSVSTDVIASGNIQSYLRGSKQFDGKIKLIRTNAIFNVPVKSWGKNSITATGSVYQQHINLSGIIPTRPALNLGDHLTVNKLTVGLTASFTRIDSLFGLPVSYTGSITGVTGDSRSIQNVSFLGGLTFGLKRTATTRIGLGMLVNINPSISVPVIPVFNYWHKFNDHFELNVTMPQQVMLRQNISPKFWINYGSSLSGSTAFFKNTMPGIPEKGNYTTLDIKSGVGFEYRFARRFVFGMNGGILSTLQAREFEQGSKSKDYFIKNKISPAPYVNVSISFLPFL